MCVKRLRKIERKLALGKRAFQEKKNVSIYKHIEARKTFEYGCESGDSS